MKGSRIVFLAMIMLLVLLMAGGVWANGKKKTTTTQPTGAGPGEAVSAISIAPISVIQQRGHVDNMGESQEMLMNSIKQSGGQRTVGDYQVAYMVDPPKGYYQTMNGQLTWVPPAPGETQHIEVVVLDSLTNKPIPVSPTINIIDQSGNVVQSKQLSYFWSPMADHYGANFSIPTAGTYSIRVQAPAPDILRHDRNLGDRFTSPVDVTFSNVQLTPKSPAASESTGTTPSGAGPTQPSPTVTPAPETPETPAAPMPETPESPANPSNPVTPESPAEPAS
ncbi:MAG: hypothetical protein ABFD64_11215 [Armatimonadota bacterium]